MDTEKTIYHISGVAIPFKADVPPDENDIAVSQHIADELQDLVDTFQKQVDAWGKKYGCKAHLKTEVEIEHIEVL